MAEAYRRFGEDAAGATSPLHARVAVALSGSEAALRALEAVPARARRPPLVLAALHDLVLAGRAPDLAEAYAAADGDAAARAAVDTVVRMAGALAAAAGGRQVRSPEAGRSAVLHPGIAEAARRVGAEAVGLVDVSSPVGLNLHVDRICVTYDGGPVVGDPSSCVQLTTAVVGDRPVPALAVPPVVSRVRVGTDLVDVTDADDARWLRACVAPDLPERAAELEAALAVITATPPVLLRGDPVEVLADAVARVPAGALPVVTTTWALSACSPERRARFLERLGEAAAGRPVAWVSAEGVGVAPEIPTLGDRRASGHSILGLALFDGSVLRAEAVGRCWSRGRLLSWLADS